MVNAFSILGAIFGLLIGAALNIAAVGYLIHCRAESAFQRDKVLARDTKRNVGTALVRYAYWFSEEPAAMKAIECIGREIQQSAELDIGVCRDRWRGELERLEAEKVSP